MKNSQWLRESIKLLKLTKNKVVVSIINIVSYFIGKGVCQNENELFAYFDLLYFVIMYILISVMVEYATKDLNKDKEA